MPVTEQLSVGNGVPFLVSAGIVYEIIAANCSSPQTTEINADKRAGTLMKWVNIGVAQSVLFVGLAVAFDRPRAKAYLVGGGLAMVIQYACFAHAKASGQANPGPSTESTPTPASYTP